MISILLTVAVSVAQPPTQPPAQGNPRTSPPANQNQNPSERTTPTSLDGTWTVLSIEKQGQPVPEAKQMTVTIKDNTITCSGKDGKKTMTWKVDFADKGMVRVKASEGESSTTTDKAGVYVLTSDMLAVCLHEAGTGTTGNTGTGTNNNANQSQVSTSGPNAKSDCTIVLKREGAGRGNDRNDR
jgi:uncharacterized protein (TIGR03067 family)